MGRTAPLTFRHCILYIYSTNIRTEYFKHAAHSPFFSHQNAVYFIMLPCLVSVLFAFYIQGVLKFKCKVPVPKGYWNTLTCLDRHLRQHCQFVMPAFLLKAIFDMELLRAKRSPSIQILSILKTSVLKISDRLSTRSCCHEHIIIYCNYRRRYFQCRFTFTFL